MSGDPNPTCESDNVNPSKKPRLEENSETNPTVLMESPNIKSKEDDEEIINELDVEEGVIADTENCHHHATSGAGHFIGIQPSGNLFFSDKKNCRNNLGLLTRFDDEFILDNILPYFSGVDLARLACVNKALYAFIYGSEDLWREITLATFQGDFTFQYFWRTTFAVEYQRRHAVPHPTIPLKYVNQHANTALDYTEVYPTYESARPAVKLTDFFSDTLFQPWYCADALQTNYQNLIYENVERVNAKDLTIEEFREKYANAGKPVVVSGVGEHWKAYEEWKIDNLLTAPYFKDTEYTVGVTEVPMNKFLTYSRRVKHDEVPLYLFDKHFVEKTPEFGEHWDLPPFLAEDFFSYLKEHKRPSWRWILIGAAGSGSSFHKDPLYTQAFNVLQSGMKWWCLYPPHITPPGIQASADHLQVRSPISVAEWVLNYYPKTRVPQAKVRNLPSEGYCHVRDFPMKCSSYEHFQPTFIIQRPGDLVFIPSQFWHSALNLPVHDEAQGTGYNSPGFTGAIAVTANSIHESNYLDCLKFLRKIDQENMALDLEQGVEEKYPGLKQRLIDERTARLQSRVAQAASTVIDGSAVVDGVIQSGVSVMKKDFASCFTAARGDNKNTNFSLSCDADTNTDTKEKTQETKSTNDNSTSGGFSFGFSF